MKRFRAAQIQRRRDTRSAVALDGDQNPIRKGDKVKVMDGPFINREGEVKHLYRGTAFIYNRKVCRNILLLTWGESFKQKLYSVI